MLNTETGRLQVTTTCKMDSATTPAYLRFHRWKHIPKPQRLIPCSSYYCLHDEQSFRHYKFIQYSKKFIASVFMNKETKLKYIFASNV